METKRRVTRFRACRQWASLLAVGVSVFSSAVFAQPYTSLYVFGDSLSDPGNNAVVFNSTASPPFNVTLQSEITSNAFVPTYPYDTSLQYSNSDVWVYGLATRLGLPSLSVRPVLSGGTNYAFGGARTGPLDTGGTQFPESLLTQVDRFVTDLGPASAPADALYVLEGGGNNARDAIVEIAGGADPSTTIAAYAAQFASDMGGMIDSLQAKGAQHIVAWNVTNIGDVPSVSINGPAASAVGTAVAQAMNEALVQRLASEPEVILYDAYAFFQTVRDNPSAYSLVNVTDAFGADFPTGGDPSTYLFWDGVHPTSQGHALIADSMYSAVVPEPAVSVAATGVAIASLTVFLRRRRR